jgi:hypothetical protein
MAVCRVWCSALAGLPLKKLLLDSRDGKHKLLWAAATQPVIFELHMKMQLTASLAAVLPSLGQVWTLGKVTKWH